MDPRVFLKQISGSIRLADGGEYEEDRKIGEERSIDLFSLFYCWIFIVWIRRLNPHWVCCTLFQSRLFETGQTRQRFIKLIQSCKLKKYYEYSRNSGWSVLRLHLFPCLNNSAGRTGSIRIIEYLSGFKADTDPADRLLQQLQIEKTDDLSESQFGQTEQWLN